MKDFPGPPPWHWNCRSMLVPILKSFSDLDPSDQRKMPVGTRASMNGQVPANMTYNDWFKTLSEEEQRDVLGDAKWEIWNRKNLSMRDMLDQDGNPLTLEELDQRVALMAPTVDVIGENDTRALAEYKDSYEGEIFSGSADKVRKKVEKVLREHDRMTNYEWAYVFDAETGETYAPITMGQRGSVNPFELVPGNDWRETAKRMNDGYAITYHTHPSDQGFGASLSHGDLIFIHTDHMFQKEIWALSHTGETYSARVLAASDRPGEITNAQLVTYFKWNGDGTYFSYWDKYVDIVKDSYDMDEGDTFEAFGRGLAAHRMNTVYDELGLIEYQATLPAELQEMYEDTLGDIQKWENAQGVIQGLDGQIDEAIYGEVR